MFVTVCASMSMFVPQCQCLCLNVNVCAGAWRPVAAFVCGETLNIKQLGFRTPHLAKILNRHIQIVRWNVSDWRGSDKEEEQGVCSDQEWDGGEGEGQEARVQKYGSFQPKMWLVSIELGVALGLFGFHPWNVAWSIAPPSAGERGQNMPGLSNSPPLAYFWNDSFPSLAFNAFNAWEWWGGVDIDLLGGFYHVMQHIRINLD